jgi:hypothetical protein
MAPLANKALRASAMGVSYTEQQGLYGNEIQAYCAVAHGQGDLPRRRCSRMSLPGSEAVFLNGVDALTGGPLRDARTIEEIVKLATAEYTNTPKQDREQLRSLSRAKSSRKFGMDVDKLDDVTVARWGVIVPAGDPQHVADQLSSLIDHRAAQLGSQPRVFEVEPDTQASEFLRANGAERGMGVVSNVPYYLLIAGDPEQIPFRFQMEINTEYATGRLHFEAPSDYAAYAESVVAYERGAVLGGAREVAFWAPDREVDPATSSSARLLVQPLFDGLPPDAGFAKRLWRGDGDGNGVKPASKDELNIIMTSGQRPSLLFTASHGLGFKQPDPGQPALDGALLTQEYVWQQSVDQAKWYSAQDLARGARLDGLIHFAFACFSAGTPKYDDYAAPDALAPVIAEHAFVAALPRQMLAQGALGFVGHIEQAWGYSFLSNQLAAGPQVGITPLEAFRRALSRILAGKPIGFAMRDHYDRGVHLSSSLLEMIAFRQRNEPVSNVTLAQTWIERNDARAYMVLGDPAVRLQVGTLGQNGKYAVAVATPASAAAIAAALTPAITPPPEAGATPSAPAEPPRPEMPSFLPLHLTDRDPTIDHELLQAWQGHIKAGFQQNSRMFTQVLSAFMIPYWVTVVCYVILFAVGVIGFAVAAFLAVQQQLAFAAIFGGMSVATFLTFFISRPLRSLEQNLLFITWLGVVYNTYWTQLMNAVDPRTIRDDIQHINRQAVGDLDRLARRQKNAPAEPVVKGEEEPEHA